MSKSAAQLEMSWLREAIQKKKVHIFGLCPKYCSALPSHTYLGLNKLGQFWTLKTPPIPSEIGTFKFEKYTNNLDKEI